MAEISIEADKVLAASHSKPLYDCGAQTTIALAFDEPDLFRPEFSHEFGRTVAALVIHDEHFCAHTHFPNSGQKSRDKQRKTFSFAVSRDNDS